MSLSIVTTTKWIIKMRFEIGCLIFQYYVEINPNGNSNNYATRLDNIPFWYIGPLLLGEETGRFISVHVMDI